MSYFPPGSTIGILGGGQLGRMMILAGRPLGYRFQVFEPVAGSTAGRIADRHFEAAYTDQGALGEFADGVDVITLEFENIPRTVVEYLQARRPLRPGLRALEVCQHRLREKQFLADGGFPHVPFREADSPQSLAAAVADLDGPVVVKTAAFGYDGKGQVKLEQLHPGEAETLWGELGHPERVVVEKWVDFSCEISAVCARAVSGATCVFPVAENKHRNHILHQSLVPARVSESVREQAEKLACELATELEVVGLLAVEYFVTQSGDILVNEMAPRPHNSGHYTLDACLISQFAQHVRMVVGLEPAAASLLSPAVMTNLLGDLWQQGEPNWLPLLETPGAHLHLYDKGAARVGRKMGHFNLLGDELKQAQLRADRIFSDLARI